MIAVIAAAAATLWVSITHGVPMVALSLAALIAVALIRFSRNDNQQH